MLTLLINESNPLDGLFANSTTGGVGTVPDITVADAGQAVSVQSFTRAGGIITDSFVAGDALHIGIGDGVNAPVCYVALSSASPATGTMPINTAGMVALFAATVANQLSLTLAVVRTRGAYTNTIFSAPIVIRRSAINISTAVPTPSILGTGVAAALQVAINTALGFVRLDASARYPALDGSQITNLAGGSLTVGTTAIASGTTTRVLFDNAGVLGEYAISGTGSVAMTTSPSFTTPTIGDGAESAPSLSFTSDTNTGLYRPTADTVGIVGGGHDILRLTDVASATDYLEIKNGIGVGSPLHVLAEGGSANIGVHLQPKGSGLFTISDGTDFNKGIRFRSSSSAASAITLLDAVSTAGRVVTLPDATGTLALVSGDLGTPSALVGTSITGTASGLTAGLVTSIGDLTGDVTSSNRATTLATVNSNVGSFTNASVTVNAKGLVTAASSGTAAVTSITGTANEITVTGTTTPTLSLPSALTFTGKTVTGGTFSAPTLFEPQAVVYKILDNQDGTRQGRLTNDFKHVFLDSGGDVFLRWTDFISQYHNLAHFSASTGQMSLGMSAFLSGKIGFKNSTSTGTTTLASANVSATDYTATLPAATGTLLLSDGSGANLTALNASNVSSGTLADARLSANVPLENAANTFTGTTNTFTLPTTTGTTTTSGIAIAGNSLTTGTGIYLASSTLTSGKAMDIQVSGTAAAASQTALNVATAGANGTSGITSKGAVISNTHTGTTSTNVALELTASGGTTANYAINSTAGDALFTVSSGKTISLQVADGSLIPAVVLNSTNASNRGQAIRFQASGANMWGFGCDYSANGTKNFWLNNYTDSKVGLFWAPTTAFTTVGAATNAASQLAVAGNCTIGSGITGTAAPTNGLQVEGNTILTAALITTPEALAPALNAGAACGVTTVASGFALNGVNALTLANGTNGQIKTIVCTAVTAAGTATLTPTTCSGFTTVAFTAAGQTLTLQYFTTGGWVILSVRGATPA